MKKEIFENVCEAVNSGQEKHVKHQISDEVGTILLCDRFNFEVEISGEHKKWAMQNCDNVD